MFGYTWGYFVSALSILRYTFKLQPMKAVRPILNCGKELGMNLNRNLIDWPGGFPYDEGIPNGTRIYRDEHHGTNQP